MIPPASQMRTTEDAAVALGVSTQKIRSMIKCGHLNATKFGNRYRIHADHLEEKVAEVRDGLIESA